jgi:hypothetical protein
MAAQPVGCPNCGGTMQKDPVAGTVSCVNPKCYNDGRYRLGKQKQL